MKAVYIQKGHAVDYTPAADVAAGDVIVIGTLVGIAKLDIADGKLGALAVRGVYDIEKAVGEITAGAIVYWDDTAKNVTTTSSPNTRIGKALELAASAATHARILLNA